MEGGLDAPAGAVRCQKGRGKYGEESNQSSPSFNMGPPCADYSSTQDPIGTEGEKGKPSFGPKPSRLQVGCPIVEVTPPVKNTVRDRGGEGPEEPGGMSDEDWKPQHDLWGTSEEEDDDSWEALTESDDEDELSRGRPQGTGRETSPE